MRLWHCSFLLLRIAAGAAVAPAQTWVAQSSGTTASLRGVSVASPSVVWASGAGGTYLRTVDGGAAWHAAIVPGAGDLDFRAVHALDGRTAWLMSSGPGDKSRIYKTTDGGAHWSLLYTNPDAAGFFDALAFWDARHAACAGRSRGWAVRGADHREMAAQPGSGANCRRRCRTKARSPPATRAWGCAANAEMWFGTGGASGARVFHSRDGGLHWQVADTPLRHDGAGAGIFSLAFADMLHGVAVGGDYGKPADATGNVAVTADGGRVWTAPDGGHPHGYRSAVAYLNGRKVWIAVGTSGSDISGDGGQSWKAFDSGAYNAIGTGGGDAVWAAGPGGRVGHLEWR